MKLLIYRIYQFLVMLPVLLIATVLTAIITIIGSMTGAGRIFGYYPAKIWARLFCILTLVKVTVAGRENITKGTSYVFVANHQGAYDIFSIYGYLGHNFRWLMKKELRSIPLVGYACERAGQVYVDNSTPRGIASTMKSAEKLLEHGMSIVVFPEGARTWNGKMRRFKRGAFMLADEFKLPVVPITIDGAFSVLPRFKKLPVWGHIHLTIHRPIEPEADGHDINQLMDQSRNAIEESLPAGQHS